MRISDWSSDVCSSDLRRRRIGDLPQGQQRRAVGHEDRGIVGEIGGDSEAERIDEEIASLGDVAHGEAAMMGALCQGFGVEDRKSTRLNSRHQHQPRLSSYALNTLNVESE